MTPDQMLETGLFLYGGLLVASGLAMVVSLWIVTSLCVAYRQLFETPSASPA